MRDLLLSKVFVSVKNQLAECSFIYDAYDEARLLISYVLKLNLEEFLLQNNQICIDQQKQLLLKHLVNRRTKGEPIAYIIKNKEFFSRNFYVDNRVLIPRPDTEVLIEAVVTDYSGLKHPLSILELGIGSGCIIITLLSLLKNSVGIGVDISQGALDISSKNARSHKVEKRLTCIKSDWFSSLNQQKFDIILSNPPYIRDEDNLITDYQSIKFEPKIALFTNNNQSYKEIASKIRKFLKSDGALYLEIGKDTESEIISIYEQANMKCTKIYKDLAGIIRCLKFQFIE